MSNQPYFGPAGIFSTGDPIADQRQIDCEQFDPLDGQEPDDEVEDLEYWDEEPQIQVFTGCKVNSEWWGLTYISEDDFEAYKVTAKAEHAKECSCGNDENFIAEVIS